MGMEVVLFEVTTTFFHCIQTKVRNPPSLDTFLLPKEQVRKAWEQSNKALQSVVRGLIAFSLL
jgi:hypothetical protein